MRTPQQQYMQQMHGASGVPQPPASMVYPLYGVDGLGQDDSTTVPFYRKPLFCVGVGVGVGVGIGYLYWGLLKPMFGKHSTSKSKKNGDGE